MSSNSVNHGQLKEIMEHSWSETKERYDGTFKNVSLDNRTLKFSKANGSTQTVDVILEKFAKTNERTIFTKDVSSDNVAEISNVKFGNLNGDVNDNRVSGHRDITSKSFVDGYIDHMIIYTDSSLEVNTSTTWDIWAVKKGNTRDDDRIFKKYNKTANVEERVLNGISEKCVKISIEEAFENEVYFIVRCGNGRRIKVCVVSSKYLSGVVNLSAAPNDTVNSTINWGTNAENNVAVIYLFGRESIGSLSEKINSLKSGQVLSVNSQSPDTNGNITVGISHIENLQTQLDAKVPKTDLVATGGTAAQQDKVPKLNSNGKLDTSFIPELAITRVKEYADKATALNALTAGVIQEGDVVVITNEKNASFIVNSSTTGNFEARFTELGMGNGAVKKIHGGAPDSTGNISVSITESGESGITMTFGTGGTALKIVSYMTNEEVNEIKALFV